jgi:hypothetical protein
MKKETKTVLTTVALTIVLFVIVGLLFLFKLKPAEFIYQKF